MFQDKWAVFDLFLDSGVDVGGLPLFGNRRVLAELDTCFLWIKL